ncbi:OmpH family outer membrane protein [Saccharicrinis sp. FJH62]|uniref:OmpH family outer membrane protein n=1 Tax=Saccharicrinis sp. FJH62 TaxID=3344657 RepID=UPI0035D436DE
MKKTAILFLLVVLPFAVMNIQGQTKYKFGHIDSQALLQKMPEMDKAMGTLEDLQTSNNEKLKMMQGELQKLNSKYVSESKTLDAIARQSREKELQMMSQNIQDFYQSAQQDMQQQQTALTQPILDKARKAVEEVGKENGFTYIFDLSKGEVLYMGDQSVDIMPLVLKKLGITEDNATAQ